MYKNLNCELLSITGRQSEVIELALTYGFRGIDIDISDLVKRCQRGSFESAARFLTSSKLNVGSFEAPIDLDADDETFTSQLALLNVVAETANRAEARTAVIKVPSETDRLPFPEYFEVVRKRVDEIAAVFEQENVNVALSFSTQSEGEDKQFKFIRDVENFVVLAKSCPKAGIVFDSWQWFCGAGTMEQLDEIGVDRVMVVRLGDCVEGVAPGAATSGDCLLPASTGVIDNVAYLQKLKTAEKSLPVSAQGRLAEPGGTRDAFVGKTQNALHKVMEEAGIPSATRNPDSFVETRFASNAE